MNGRWLGILWILWAVSPVSAQDVRVLARQHFEEGVRRFDARDYESALIEFHEAYRLKPHPSVRVNIANCYERLGKPVEAVTHYEAYLEEAGSTLAVAERRQIKRTITRLQHSIGTLTLELSPPGANVRIDGQPFIQNDRGSISLSQGGHILEVDAVGYASERRQIAIHGKERTVETIALAPAVSKPTAEPATPHTNSADEGSLHFRLTTPVLVAGGVTAALLVSAIVTGVLALNADGDFDDALARSRDTNLSNEERQRAVQEGEDAADSANTLATVTDVLFVSTVIGAGVTAFLLFNEAERRPQNAQAHRNQFMASPYFDAHQAGLTVKGRF